MIASTAAIIAGGHGTRLSGEVKGLLVVDGRRIIDRQLEVLRAVFDRVVLVAGDPAPWDGLGVPVVPDAFVDGGPLAGIEAALRTLTVGSDAVVCVASDMPFLDAGILRILRERAPDADAVVPRVAGKPEPLLARYAARVQPIVAARLGRGERAVHRLLEQLAVTWLDEPELRAVDPQLRFLTNINTPADLGEAHQMARWRP